MNNLSEGNAIRYVGKLFGIPPFADGRFHRWDTAVNYMLDHVDQSNLPEGLSGAVFVPDRLSLVGSLWCLNKKSRLWKIAEEVMDADKTCYMLVSDTGIPGAEGLFLLACGHYASQGEAVEDMKYHLEEWSLFAGREQGLKAGISTATGGMTIDGGVFSVQAVRLATLKQKYAWGENATIEC